MIFFYAASSAIEQQQKHRTVTDTQSVCWLVISLHEYIRVLAVALRSVCRVCCFSLSGSKVCVVIGGSSNGVVVIYGSGGRDWQPLTGPKLVLVFRGPC